MMSAKWEHGRMTGRTWGRGQERTLFQICGVQVPEAMFVYFNKMNNHVFTIIKSTPKFTEKYTHLVSKVI